MDRKKHYIQKWVFSLLSLIIIFPVFASFDERLIDLHKTKFNQLAMDLWDYSELGYQETQSVDAIANILESEGFTLKRNVANIPTAFIAEYGKDGPVIGILGEFDALPGLAQTRATFREVENNSTGAGQACGHHLFGAASAWAAVAIKDWLKENNIEGTIRFYGTPAEEGGSGKVYMVRAGLFKDVDIVFHWHPDDQNSANIATNNSNKSAKFLFKGISFLDV